MALQSFEDWLKAWIKRLPRRTSEFVLSGLALISWISAPINFVSQIAQLQIVVNLWRSLLANIGQFSSVLSWVAEFIGPLVISWRQILEPARSWLESLLTVRVPFIVLHAGLMVVLCLPTIARYFISRATIVVRRLALRRAVTDAFNDPAIASKYRNRKDTYREPAEIISDLFANGGPDVEGIRAIEARFEKPRGPLAYMGIRTRSEKVQLVLSLCSRIRRDLGILRNSLVFLIFVALFAITGFVLVLANQFV